MIRLSARLASELVSRWDVVVFGENLVGAYGEDALIDVAECVRALDPRVSKADVGEGIGRVLYEAFKRAAEEAAGRSTMGGKGPMRTDRGADRIPARLSHAGGGPSTKGST